MGKRRANRVAPAMPTPTPEGGNERNRAIGQQGLRQAPCETGARRGLHRGTANKGARTEGIEEVRGAVVYDGPAIYALEVEEAAECGVRGSFVGRGGRRPGERG